MTSQLKVRIALKEREAIDQFESGQNTLNDRLKAEELATRYLNSEKLNEPDLATPEYYYHKNRIIAAIVVASLIGLVVLGSIAAWIWNNKESLLKPVTPIASNAIENNDSENITASNDVSKPNVVAQPPQTAIVENIVQKNIDSIQQEIPTNSTKSDKSVSVDGNTEESEINKIIPKNALFKSSSEKNIIKPSNVVTAQDPKNTTADEVLAQPVQSGALVAVSVTRPDLVSTALLVDSVNDRTPGSPLKETIALNDADITRIFFFTQMNGLEGRSPRHRWYRNDQLIAEVKMPNSRESWPGYSSKFITQKMTGNWRVELVINDLDTSGTEILSKAQFSVVP